MLLLLLRLALLARRSANADCRSWGSSFGHFSAIFQSFLAVLAKFLVNFQSCFEWPGHVMGVRWQYETDQTPHSHAFSSVMASISPEIGGEIGQKSPKMTNNWSKTWHSHAFSSVMASISPEIGGEIGQKSPKMTNNWSKTWHSHAFSSVMASISPEICGKIGQKSPKISRNWPICGQFWSIFSQSPCLCWSRVGQRWSILPVSRWVPSPWMLQNKAKIRQNSGKNRAKTGQRALLVYY